MYIRAILLAILLLFSFQGCTFPTDSSVSDQPGSIEIEDRTQASSTGDQGEITSPGQAIVEATPGVFVPLIVGAGGASEAAPADSPGTEDVYVPVIVGAGPSEALIPSMMGGAAPQQGEQRKLYVLQPGSPVGMVNFVHPDLGCNWMGIGGQVFSSSGEPVLYLVVELGGTLNGRPVSALALTGSAPQWGTGGFEFTLANSPVASQGSLWLRFYDLTGEALSYPITFSTKEDCAQSVILVNMVETTAVQSGSLLPLILR